MLFFSSSLRPAGAGDGALAPAADDEAQLTSGGRDKSIRLWDLGSSRPVGHFNGHSQPIRSVAVSAAGNQVLSCGDDNTLRLWDLSRISPAASIPAPIPPKPTTPTPTPVRAAFQGHTLPVTCRQRGAANIDGPDVGPVSIAM